MFRINSTFAVLLDACVLYPARMRDLLISLSHAGVFRARCTEQIHNEWTRSLQERRPNLSKDAIARTRTLMDEAMDGWLIEGYEPLIDGLTLPDPDDRHVLAAAIRGRCDIIVTQNLKDFPADVLKPYDIQALPPDDFIALQIDIDKPTFISAVTKLRARLKAPPVSAQEYLDSLTAKGLPKTAEALAEWIDVI